MQIVPEKNGGAGLKRLPALEETSSLAICDRRRWLQGVGLVAGGVLVGQYFGLQQAMASVLGESTLATGLAHPYRRHFAMVVQQDRCTGCGQCVTACGQLHLLPEGGQRLMILERPPGGDGPSFMPVMCGHCLEAPCLSVCPTRATFRDESSGLVLMNEQLCVGCRACQVACPYNARYFNSRNQAMDHCDFCFTSRLRDNRGNPACVDACPHEALVFGDLLENANAVSQLLVEHQNRVKILRPEKGTRMNLYFL